MDGSVAMIRVRICRASVLVICIIVVAESLVILTMGTKRRCQAGRIGDGAG
jgi:hypothetical protein